jgi:hypothetical protein
LGSIAYLVGKPTAGHPENVAEGAVTQGIKREKWILDPARTPGDLLLFIASNELGPTSYETSLARSALKVRICETCEASSVRVQKLTRWLIGLTWVVSILALLLLIAEFRR